MWYGVGYFGDRDFLCLVSVCLRGLLVRWISLQIFKITYN